MEHHIDFIIVGDPARAKATVEQELVARGFRLTWSDPWTAVAERGSKAGNLFAGALAQYFKVGVRVMSGNAGQSIVELDQLSSGWMGGAIGASRTKKNLERLRDDLWKAFYDAGVLVNVAQA